MTFIISPAKTMLKNLLEQWSLTGGRDSSLAISWFFTFLASSSCQMPDKITIKLFETKTTLFSSCFIFQHTYVQVKNAKRYQYSLIFLLPILWQGSLMQSQIHSQMSWTLHQQFSHLHQLLSMNKLILRTKLTYTWHLGAPKYLLEHVRGY